MGLFLRCRRSNGGCSGYSSPGPRLLTHPESRFSDASWVAAPLCALESARAGSSLKSDEQGLRRERPTRIELASSAWKAEVLPLNYGRESGSSLKPLLSTPWTHCMSG